MQTNRARVGVARGRRCVSRVRISNNSLSWVCALNILLLHALCIMNELTIPFLVDIVVDIVVSCDLSCCCAAKLSELIFIFLLSNFILSLLMVNKVDHFSTKRLRNFQGRGLSFFTNLTHFNTPNNAKWHHATQVHPPQRKFWHHHCVCIWERERQKIVKESKVLPKLYIHGRGPMAALISVPGPHPAPSVYTVRPRTARGYSAWRGVPVYSQLYQTSCPTLN